MEKREKKKKKEKRKEGGGKGESPGRTLPLPTTFRQSSHQKQKKQQFNPHCWGYTPQTPLPTVFLPLPAGALGTEPLLCYLLPLNFPPTACLQLQRYGPLFIFIYIFYLYIYFLFYIGEMTRSPCVVNPPGPPIPGLVIFH